MTFGLEEKEESTDVFSAKDLSLWAKGLGAGRQEIPETQHIPLGCSWALPKAFFVRDRMETRLGSLQANSSAANPRRSVFLLLSSHNPNINLILDLSIMILISWDIRESFIQSREGGGHLMESIVCSPLEPALWMQGPVCGSFSTLCISASVYSQISPPVALKWIGEWY